MTDTMPCTRVPSAARLKHWLAAGFIALLASTAATAQTRAALVKDVDSPASQPFAASSGVVNFPAGSSNASSTLLTVPAGKRAILEHVSCIDFLETGNNFVRMEKCATRWAVSRSDTSSSTRASAPL